MIPGGLLRQVRSFARNYDWIIIDGPPGIGRITADAVRAADIVLIPTKLSPFDVLAASDVVEAVQARQRTADGLPRAFFVVTMARAAHEAPCPGGYGACRVWDARTDRQDFGTRCISNVGN